MEPTFDFGYALKLIKDGKKVARIGWNGKGMFIYLVKGSTVDKENLRNEAYTHLKDCDSCGDSTGVVTVNSHVDMKAADGSITIGWAPRQPDMMADDWMAVA